MCSPEERDLRLHTKKMETLFEAADESGDGVIAPRVQRHVQSLLLIFPSAWQFPVQGHR